MSAISFKYFKASMSIMIFMVVVLMGMKVSDGALLEDEASGDAPLQDKESPRFFDKESPCPDEADVDSWNGVANNQFNNNCYNYATNKQTDTYAQPGRASGLGDVPFAELNCEDVAQRAVADGLVRLGPTNQICPFDQCLVALYVGFQYDYHWYRQNDDDNWSHKPASAEARIFDDSGVVIGSSLLGMDSGPYSFCEYMCVPLDVEVVVEDGVVGSSGPNTGALQAADTLEIFHLIYSGRPSPTMDVATDSVIALLIVQAVNDAEENNFPEDPFGPNVLGNAGYAIPDLSPLNLDSAVVAIRVFQGFIQFQTETEVFYTADGVGLELALDALFVGLP